MLPTTIRSPPAAADYIPLSEYQSQTPETFHGGKPVLHYHAAGAKAWVPASQRGALAIFPADSAAAAPTGPEGAVLNGVSDDYVEQKVDLFVNSESFTLFCPATESGVSIPYPAIILHATRQIGSGAEQAAPPAPRRYMSIYMQLQLSGGGGGGGGGGDDDDEPSDIIELTIVPPEPPAPSAEPPARAAQPTEADRLFKAISECSNLHPDPAAEGDSDEDGEGGDRIVFEGEAIEGFTGLFRGSATGGLPPPVPGSSGWITADNVHEYFDEEGNWIGGGGAEEGAELGEGAGRVRVRDEADGREGGAGGAEGDGAASGESKRPRTE